MFVGGTKYIRDGIECKVLASLTQCFLLSTFFWMGVEGYSLYKKIVRATKNIGESRKFFSISCVFCWGKNFTRKVIFDFFCETISCVKQFLVSLKNVIIITLENPPLNLLNRKDMKISDIIESLFKFQFFFL